MTCFLAAPRPHGSRSSLRLVGLVVVLALAFGVGLAPVSSADPIGDKKRIDAAITRLRAALDDTSQVLARAFLELQRTKAELPGARRALAAAQGVQAAADRFNEAVAMALAVAEANAAKAADALAQNVRQEQQVQDQIGNLARDDYQQGGVSGLSIALEASSPEDFTNRMVMMDTILMIRRDTLSGLDTVRAEGRAVQAHLTAVRQQVAALKVQAEAALARATSARKAAAAAKTRLDRLYAAQIRYAATVAARKAAEISNMNRMQARSDYLKRLLAARAARRHGHPGGPPVRGSGFLSLPANGPMSSGFGMRVDPVLRIWRLHAGIDFAAECGAPVFAAAAGEVILATPESQSGGFGNQLVIDHGIQHGVDLTTTYNHLSSFVVTAGHVARGQLVAYIGTTGLSTGCHLHFETLQDGVPVDPRAWL